MVGPSGSGKRSLVLAGLVPALARQAESAGMPPKSFVLTPGFEPFENLARVVPPDEDLRREAQALKADPARLTEALDAVSADPSLLIVDRFEEVFAEECLRSEGGVCKELGGSCAIEAGASARAHSRLGF